MVWAALVTMAWVWIPDPVGAQEATAGPQVQAGGAQEAATAATAADSADPTEQLLRELQAGFDQKLPFFGLSLFGVTGGELPAWNRVPISPFYQLGPGDVVLVEVWGSMDLSLELPVTDQGYVTGPGMERVYVNGLAFGQLEEVILRELRKHHAQALGQERFDSGVVNMEVKLGDVHGIQVLVAGQVAKPGGYTFESPTVLLMDALAKAGGITSRGSLRQVAIRRGGKERRLDLYDLLVGGQIDISRFLLRQGDVVFVRYRERTVSMRGSVRQPAIYELTGDQRLDGLLEMAGGMTPEADAERVQIERIEAGRGSTLLDFDLTRTRASAVALADGDRVTVMAMPAPRRRQIVTLEGGGVVRAGVYELDEETRNLDALLARAGLHDDAVLKRCLLIRTGADYAKQKHVINVAQVMGTGLRLHPEDRLIINSRFELAGGDKTVTLSGHVKDPGTYSLAQGLTLYDLLANYGGFEDPDYRSQTYLPRGDIVRLDKETGQNATIPFDLAAVLGRVDDFPLQSADQIVVYDRDRFRDREYVVSEGEVRVPGRYELKQGMNLADLLVMAGGVTDQAHTGQIEVSRPELESSNLAASIFVDAEQTATLALQDMDVVHIRGRPYWQPPAMVSVFGQVQFPGAYVLQKSNERLSDLVRRAGGLSGQAFTEGARFWRQYDGTRRRVALDLEKALGGDSKYDLVLVAGDSLSIPVSEYVIEVQGAVGMPQLVQYVEGKGADYYVENAGGFTKDADHRRVNIRRANGLILPAFPFLARDPVVPAGSTLIVPEREANGAPTPWRNRVLVLVVGLVSGWGLQWAAN